ncbi:expressed unknown protein [Seminavis robusta]|uniref:Uncharacterized protein n=1 Tax=Seminavis robusta TaxID=568900 RepID=A0A9N8HCS6_9STRA|nr:expressed unknown protein [Seminavis robusta]|eukprot:Sro426_g140460.1 n/a (468) ;mRNA; f:40131-41534
MEASGEELGRIVAFVNRRTWLMEEPPSSDAIGSNYFLDNIGTTSFGDSSLLRLCAWHPTPDQFTSFVDHMEAHQEFVGASKTGKVIFTSENDKANNNLCYLDMPSPPNLSQTNHKGVTALHMAVYRNSFHANSIVKQLLHKQPSLASTPMQCGSYPLHILCAHSLTIRKEILLQLLEADPSVVWLQDQNGDTPLSLLWKNVLRFRWAQQEEVKFEDEEEEEDPGNNYYNRGRIRRPSWMTVITPDQFVEFSLLMIKAALHKDVLHLVDVCRMPRCPPVLVQLVLQRRRSSKLAKHLVQGSIFWRATDELGMTPLHHASRVEVVTMDFVPAHVQALQPMSIVDCLLRSFPSMAFVKDRWGRIALHHALEKAFHFPSHHLDHGGTTNANELHRFVAANPDSLRIKDPVSGLYPFALLATKATTAPRPLAKSYYDDDMMMQLDETADSEDHLQCVFRLLRQFPEAALYLD